MYVFLFYVYFITFILLSIFIIFKQKIDIVNEYNMMSLDFGDVITTIKVKKLIQHLQKFLFDYLDFFLFGKLFCFVFNKDT